MLRSRNRATWGRAYTRPNPSCGFDPISGVSPALGIRPSPRHTITAWFSGRFRVSCQSPSESVYAESASASFLTRLTSDLSRPFPSPYRP